MIEKLIHKIQQWIPLTDEEIKIISERVKPLSPKKNEILITDKQNNNQKTFFVVKGCLRIFYINNDGVESTRLLVFENQFGSALVNFITDEPSFEFIQALEQTELLYFTKKDFYELLDIIPMWEKFYRKYLEYAYVNNTLRLHSFITLDATERYKQLLKENRDIVLRLPNKIVASYLNMSQETLSRIKSKI